MELTERERVIYDILCEKNRVSVSELSKLLYVSEMTVRRDLSNLSEMGLLRRFRGGAVLDSPEGDMPVSQRFYFDEDEKKLLAGRASKFLGSDMTVYIDSSSTCQYMIPHIAKLNGVTVITNSVKALMSASKLKIACILIGGEYYERDMCFVGSAAARSAAELNPDIAFFSSRGISDDGVISDADAAQTGIRRIIMKNSGKNIFLFEAGKRGKKFIYTLCRAEDADEIIETEPPKT